MSWFKSARVAISGAIGARFGFKKARTSEQGRRGTLESQQRSLYQSSMPNFDLYGTIQDIREMDKLDGPVKQIHNRTSSALTKGGLVLTNPSKNKRIQKAWDSFRVRCELNVRAKLISDARGLIVEGSLPLQFVLDNEGKHVVRAIRMPTETIFPVVGLDGQFENLEKAYSQYDLSEGKIISSFAVWQLFMVRLDPDNYDDMGSFGRPLLDATRKRWEQLMMTMDDSVKRRHLRAGQRTAHFLKGADDKDLDEYKLRVEGEENDISSNYYMNTEGSVKAVEGDANLDQIADILLMSDAFFSGSAMPKSLLGINLEGLSRDILLDMKAEWYDSLDILQDLLSAAYNHGFKLELLLQGINPEAYTFSVGYGERLTETLNQRTDRALKIRAMGASKYTSFTTAGLDPAAESKLLEDEEEQFNEYPEVDLPGVPNEVETEVEKRVKGVSVVPGNAQKGESATHIKNP